MPRAKGAKNYKNDFLIPIVAEILPNGELGWSAVALAYQEQAQEDDPCNTDDLKHHWIKNLCQNMKSRRVGQARTVIVRIAASSLNAELWKKHKQE
jgi:hypothetical protein